MYILRPLFLIFFLLLAACGGGGGGGGAANPQTGITAGFLPANANPPSNTVHLIQKSAQNDLITLNVVVTSLAVPSAGAAFDVVFDPNLVNFIGSAPGSFYETNGTVAYQAGLQAGSNNRLVVGITQQAGPGASGSGVLIELQFKAVKIGSSSLDFNNNNLTDPSANLIPGLAWSGGALTGS